MHTVIVAGRCVNADTIFDAHIEITDGIITRVGTNLGTPDVAFDNDHLIFAGMGDIHIHAREDESGEQNYKETYDTATAAALNGGVVHVAAMPNTPKPLITDTQLAWHKDRCKNLPVTFLHYAGIGPNTKPLDAAVPYKVYTGPSVGPLFFKNETELRGVLKNYAGKNVSFHVEDYDVLVKNENKETHDKRRPVECVETALKYVLACIEEYNLQAKLCHWSCGGESFELIKKHRAKGFNTTLEVSPLHLYFDTTLLQEKPELWPYLQMNPALQSAEHRKQLLQGVKDGFINFLATDHAPHTLVEKFKQFGGEENYKKLKEANIKECRRLSCLNGTSGTPQLDTYGAFTTWLMKEQGVAPTTIARIACENPGNFINQFHQGKGKFGKIAPGYYGSLTVLNLNRPTVVTRAMLKTKPGWSPFEGITFPGSVAMVMVKGEKVSSI